MTQTRSSHERVRHSTAASAPSTPLPRERTDHVIGPPTDPNEQSTIRFTATQLPLPDSGVTITLNNASDLADMYDLCTRIAHAYLDNDDGVTLSRTAPRLFGRKGRLPPRLSLGSAPLIFHPIPVPPEYPATVAWRPGRCAALSPAVPIESERQGRRHRL